MQYFLIALQFLTPLKLGKAKIVPDEELAKSMAWFSLVGLLIGLTLTLMYSLLNLFLPRIVVSAIVVILMIIISRGLHLDGLADTIDGLAAHKSKEDILRIMHDSNIGAIGAAAIFACLLIKFSCIYSIPGASVRGALIVSSVLARWAFVFSSVKWTAATEGGGLGSKFMRFATVKELFWSTSAAFTAVFFIFGLKGVFIFGLAGLLIALFNNFIKNKIGGLTGDTLGAVGELTEAFTLIIISGISK